MLRACLGMLGLGHFWVRMLGLGNFLGFWMGKAGMPLSCLLPGHRLSARSVVGVAQMSGWAGAQSLHAEGGRAIAYTGMCDCFMRTVRDEGVKALFKVRRAALP